MKFMCCVFVFMAGSLFAAPQPPSKPPTPNFDRPATSPVPGFGRSQRSREIDLARILFSRIDVNRDGSISIDEFRSALQTKSDAKSRYSRGSRTSPPSIKKGSLSPPSIKKGSLSRPPHKKND